jgi:hypothetical protein
VLCAMVKFGRTLRGHVERSGVPPESYVEYGALKQALKEGCSDTEFSALYTEQLHKVLARLEAEPSTVTQDPDYIAINRTALDQISKKFDKRQAAAFPARTTEPLRKAHRRMAERHFQSTLGELVESGLIQSLSIPRDLQQPPHPGETEMSSRAAGGGQGPVEPEDVGSAGERGQRADERRAQTTTAQGQAERHKQWAWPPGAVTFVAGAAAGLVSRTMTAPLNLVKMRMQTARRGAAKRPKGGWLLATFREVYAEGGVRAFWRGNLANMLKIVPESASRFLCYDWLTSYITARHQERLEAAGGGGGGGGGPTSSGLGPRERFVCGGVAGGVGQLMVFPLDVAKTRCDIRETMIHGRLRLPYIHRKC